MDDQATVEEIDEAVSRHPIDADPELKRPRKKRKTNKEVEPELPVVALDDLSDDQRNIRNMLTKELKQLLLDHPKLDIEAIRKLDAQIKFLTTEEIANQIENMKIQIGINSPFENSKPLAGIIGLAISHKFDSPETTQIMINDKELLCALDHFFPSSLYYLSPLMKIVYRISYHTCNAFNEKKSRINNIVQ